MESRFEQAIRVPTTEVDAARPDAGQASKTVASRFYQLKTGHALIGPYLKKIGERASDICWWCDRGVKQSREHLFKGKSQTTLHNASAQCHRQLHRHNHESEHATRLWRRGHVAYAEGGRGELHGS